MKGRENLMDIVKIKKLKDNYVNNISELRNYENFLEINEINAKNLNLIYFGEELNKNRKSNNHIEIYKSNKDKKKDLTALTRLIGQTYKLDEWSKNIKKKINYSFEQIFLKIPGYIFGIIGLMINIFSTYFAFILYMMVDPTYSMSNNWISELGIGPNGANIVFSMGWILSSWFIFLFNVYDIKFLEEKMKKEKSIYPLVLFNIIFTLGIFLVGLFPANLFVYHIFGATFYFLGGFLFFSYYGIIALFNKYIPKFHAFIAGFVILSFILFIVSAYFTVRIAALKISTTSAEWSIFIFEIYLMLLILKQLLLSTGSSNSYEEGLLINDYGIFNKNEFYLELLNSNYNKKSM